MPNAHLESGGAADGKKQSRPSALLSSVANLFSSPESRLSATHSGTPSAENTTTTHILHALLRCSIATTFRQLRSAENEVAQLQSQSQSLDAIMADVSRAAALTSAALAAPLMTHEVAVVVTAAAQKSHFLPKKIVQHWNLLRRSLFRNFCDALRTQLEGFLQNADVDLKSSSSAFEAMVEALESVLVSLSASATSATRSTGAELESPPLRVSDVLMVQEQLPRVFEMAVHAFVYIFMGGAKGPTKPMTTAQSHHNILKRLVLVCVPPLLKRDHVGFRSHEWFPQTWLRTWPIGSPQGSQSVRLDVQQLMWVSMFESATGGELDAKTTCQAFEQSVMNTCAELATQIGEPPRRNPAKVRRRVASQLRTCGIGNHFSELKQPDDINAAVHSDLRVLANSTSRDIAPVQLAELPSAATDDLDSPGAAEETSRKLQTSVGDWLGDWVSVGVASAPNTPASRRHLNRRGSAEQRGAQQWGREAYARSLPETVQSGTRSLVGTVHKLARFFSRERQELADARAFVSSQREGAQLDTTQRMLWVKVRAGLRLLLEYAVSFFEGQVCSLQHTVDAVAELPSLSEFAAVCTLHSDASLLLRTLEGRFFSARVQRHGAHGPLASLLWKLRLCVGRASHTLANALDRLTMRSWEDSFRAASDGTGTVGRESSSATLSPAPPTSRLDDSVNGSGASTTSRKTPHDTGNKLKWSKLFELSSIDVDATTALGTHSATDAMGELTDQLAMAMALAQPAVRIFVDGFLKPVLHSCRSCGLPTRVAVLHGAGAGVLAVLRRLLSRNAVRINKLGASQLSVDVSTIVLWVRVEAIRMSNASRLEAERAKPDAPSEQGFGGGSSRRRKTAEARKQHSRNGNVFSDFYVQQAVEAAESQQAAFNTGVEIVLGHRPLASLGFRLEHSYWFAAKSDLHNAEFGSKLRRAFSVTGSDSNTARLPASLLPQSLHYLLN